MRLRRPAGTPVPARCHCGEMRDSARTEFIDDRRPAGAGGYDDPGPGVDRALLISVPVTMILVDVRRRRLCRCRYSIHFGPGGVGPADLIRTYRLW